MAIISSPYILTNRDLVLLRDNPIYKWNKTYKSIQDRVRNDYCFKQRKHCCYCNTELESACNGSHIDHIVPKALKPIWMYDPINLCLSCEQCNTKKGEENTLSILARNSSIPPRHSHFYSILHPHFDNWEDHLYYEDNFFISFFNNGSNPKGKETIKICGLYRHLYIDRRLKRSYTNNLDRIEILRIKLLDDGISDILRNEIDNCINELTKYL